MKNCWFIYKYVIQYNTTDESVYIRPDKYMHLVPDIYVKAKFVLRLNIYERRPCGETADTPRIIKWKIVLQEENVTCPEARPELTEEAPVSEPAKLAEPIIPANAVQATGSRQRRSNRLQPVLSREAELPSDQADSASEKVQYQL